MGNGKNNQNKNQSTDSQTTVADNGEQKTDATTTAAVQPADEQQNTEPEQKQTDAPPPASEPPKDDTSPQDGTGETPSASAENKTAAETVTMTLRHKSHTPRYHRCGLALTKVFADYEVPADCVERIKGDKWIEVKGAK